MFHHQENEKTTQRMDKAFANHYLIKDLCLKYIKYVYKSVIKRQPIFLNAQRIWIDFSPKKIYEWPRGTSLVIISGEYKPKPQWETSSHSLNGYNINHRWNRNWQGRAEVPQTSLGTECALVQPLRGTVAVPQKVSIEFPRSSTPTCPRKMKHVHQFAQKQHL